MILIVLANVGIFCMLLGARNWWFARVITNPPSPKKQIKGE